MINISLEKLITDAKLKCWSNDISFLFGQWIAVVEFDAGSSAYSDGHPQATSNSHIVCSKDFTVAYVVEEVCTEKIPEISEVTTKWKWSPKM